MMVFYILAILGIQDTIYKINVKTLEVVDKYNLSSQVILEILSLEQLIINFIL